MYTIAAVIYGVAGLLLVARTGVGDPQAGQTDNLDSITAVVLGGTSLFGGRGGVIGTLIGALIVGVFRNGLQLIGVASFADVFRIRRGDRRASPLGQQRDLHRGKLVSMTNTLAGARAAMEQFYQDNRTYQTVGSGSTAITTPCANTTDWIKSYDSSTWALFTFTVPV